MMQCAAHVLPIMDTMPRISATSAGKLLVSMMFTNSVMSQMATKSVLGITTKYVYEVYTMSTREYLWVLLLVGSLT